MKILQFPMACINHETLYIIGTFLASWDLPKDGLLGVDSLCGDCTFIPAYGGS